jgi:hypothetical protein
MWEMIATVQFSFLSCLSKNLKIKIYFYVLLSVSVKLLCTAGTEEYI